MMIYPLKDIAWNKKEVTKTLPGPALINRGGDW